MTDPERFHRRLNVALQRLRREHSDWTWEKIVTVAIREARSR